MALMMAKGESNDCPKETAAPVSDNQLLIVVSSSDLCDLDMTCL